jgi:hypothetical protein
LNEDTDADVTPIKPNPETPWAVICPKHGRVFLSEQEYIAQMRRADRLWECLCGREAEWDDANYDEHMSPKLPGDPGV